jgi:hypothetical protein
MALIENNPSLVLGEVTQKLSGVFSIKSYSYFYLFS